MKQREKISVFFSEAIKQIEDESIIIDTDYTQDYYIKSEEQFDGDYSKLFEVMRYAKSIFFSPDFDVKKMLSEKEAFVEKEGIPLVTSQDGAYLVNLDNIGKKWRFKILYRYKIFKRC